MQLQCLSKRREVWQPCAAIGAQINPAGKAGLSVLIGKRISAVEQERGRPDEGTADSAFLSSDHGRPKLDIGQTDVVKRRPQQALGRDFIWAVRHYQKLNVHVSSISRANDEFVAGPIVLEVLKRLT